MDKTFEHLVERLAVRHGVTAQHIRQRAERRQARLHGLLSRDAAARSVGLSLALASAEQRLSGFLAAGSRHVNGLSVADAIAAAQAEGGQQHLSTIGYWPQPREAAASVAARYREAISAVAVAGLRSSVSVKVDQMGYDRELLREVAALARQHGVRLHFDAQGLETVDRTHAMMEESLAAGTDVSATLPSRWLRSASDARRFRALGIPVRIVKGQGGDPDAPKIDPRQSYLALVEVFAGSTCEVGVATHDRRVAEPVLRRLRASSTPCVLEQLRSLPRLDAVADALGVPVRAYVAFGRFGLPYAIGEVFRRPAILGWILRDALVRHRPTSTTAPRIGDGR